MRSFMRPGTTAAREPVSEGSDTNLVKNATESLSGALMSLSVSARNGGVL